MRKLYFLIFVFLTFNSIYAQELNLTKQSGQENYQLVRAGRKYLYNGEQISLKATKFVIKNHGTQEDFRKFSSGYSTRTAGSVFIYTGLVAIVTGGTFAILGAATGDDGDWMYITAIATGGGGLVFLVTGAVLGGSGHKKMGRAVDSYNRGLTKTGSNLKLNVGLTSNGVGLRVNF